MLSEMTAKQKRAWLQTEAAVSRPASRDGPATAAGHVSVVDAGTESTESEEQDDPGHDNDAAPGIGPVSHSTSQHGR